MSGLKLDRTATGALIDLQKHSGAWRASLIASMRRAMSDPDEPDNGRFWWWEIAVFDSVVATLGNLPWHILDEGDDDTP